VPWY